MEDILRATFFRIGLYGRRLGDWSPRPCRPAPLPNHVLESRVCADYARLPSAARRWRGLLNAGVCSALIPQRRGLDLPRLSRIGVLHPRDLYLVRMTLCVFGHIRPAMRSDPTARDPATIDLVAADTVSPLTRSRPRHSVHDISFKSPSNARGAGPKSASVRTIRLPDRPTRGDFALRVCQLGTQFA
jgi:hypothetical protein